MTQKKDTTNTSESANKKPETPTADATEKSSKSGGGFVWLLLVAAAIGGGIWAIEQGYVDVLLTEQTQPVMTTETKKIAEPESSTTPPSPAFEEPAPVAAKDEDISLLLHNQEASRRERAQLRKNLAAVNAEIGALSSSMQSLVKTMESKQNEPATIAVTAAPVDNSAVQAMETRVSELAARLDSLQQDYERQSVTHAVRLQILQTVGAIEERVEQGKPYADMLPRLQRLAARIKIHPESLDVLAAQSEESVSSLSELIQDFSTNAALALPYSLGAEGEASWSDTLRSNVAHVISIRRIEVATDDNSDEAHIARAEAELRNGNVDMAITHLEQLSADPQTLFNGWMQKAQRYMAVHEAIHQLQSLVIQNEYEE